MDQTEGQTDRLDRGIDRQSIQRDRQIDQTEGQTDRLDRGIDRQIRERSRQSDQTEGWTDRLDRGVDRVIQKDRYTWKDQTEREIDKNVDVFKIDSQNDKQIDNQIV